MVSCIVFQFPKRPECIAALMIFFANSRHICVPLSKTPISWGILKYTFVILVLFVSATEKSSTALSKNEFITFFPDPLFIMCCLLFGITILVVWFLPIPYQILSTRYPGRINYVSTIQLQNIRARKHSFHIAQPSHPSLLADITNWSLYFFPTY